MRSRSFPRILLFLPVLALAFSVGAMSPEAPEGYAQGGAPRPPAGRDPMVALGERFFDQAIAWVTAGKQPIGKITRFFADLHDVRFVDSGTEQQGYLRLWYATPDKFRQEWRDQKVVTPTNTTSKILNNDRAWIVTRGKLRRVHGTPDAPRVIPQLKKDREALANLSQFVTLRGLKGPRVTFRFEGKTEGDGVFAGKWLKIRRILEGGAEMVFWIAYQNVGGQDVATYPGIVKLPGDAAKGQRTEWFLLKDWKQGAQFRFPGKIEAYGQGARERQPVRFLLAFPQQIMANPRMNEEQLFLPPQNNARGG